MKTGLEERRVVFKAKDVVAVESFNLEQPAQGEVSVKTAASLISTGTETAFLKALPNTPQKFPQYPGYSNAGIVETVGEDVTEVEEGERVVSRTHHASHVLTRENELWKIPENVSFEEATFFALSAVALQGVRKARVELGETVVVLGQGLIGQLALQLAKLCGGLPVVGVDLVDSRLSKSFSLGADYVFNPRKVDLEKEVSAVSGSEGAKVVIEATGNPNVILTAFKLASTYGRVVLLGSTRGLTEVNFYMDVHKKGVTVIGAHDSVRPRRDSYPHEWTLSDDVTLVLRLLGKGILRVRDLISLKVHFERAPEAYRQLLEDKNVLGVVLDWR